MKKQYKLAQGAGFFFFFLSKNVNSEVKQLLLSLQAEL